MCIVILLFSPSMFFFFFGTKKQQQRNRQKSSRLSQVKLTSLSFSALFFEFSIPLVNQELERKPHTGIDNGTEHYVVFSGSRINLLKINWSGISKRLMPLGHVMREWNPWSRTKRTDFPNFWTLLNLKMVRSTRRQFSENICSERRFDI